MLLLCVVVASSAVAQAALAESPLLSLSSSPREILATDSSGTPLVGTELIPSGMARLDARGALLLHRGRFAVERAGALWGAALSSGAGITVELVAAPATQRMSGPGTVLSLDSGPSTPGISIVQTGDFLSAFVPDGGSTAEIKLGTVPSERLYHCALEFDGAEWRGYLNGVPVGAAPGTSVKAGAEVLSLGGAPEGTLFWEGAILRAALHGKPLGAAAIAERAAAAIEKFGSIPPMDRLVVDAELIATSPVPTIEQLAPYTQSLVVYEYKVAAVRAGSCDADRIYVAHWSVLDGTRLPFADVAPGGRYTLALELFSAQPQLQSENISDTVVEDFSRTLYYDAGGASLGIEVTPELATTSSAAPAGATSAAALPAPGLPNSAASRESRAGDIAATRARLSAQITDARGYAGWDETLVRFRDEVRRTSAEHARYTIAGLERHLFARSGTDYLLDLDLIAMPAVTAPEYPHPASAFDAIVAFDRQLKARGVDLIYVPVPAREEVYPDKLSAAAPAGGLVSPQLTRFLEALTDADVETVDLREAFIDERAKHDELLYPISEVHWGAYGIRRAAAEIAPRIRRYGFNLALPPIAYVERTARITRQGNLVKSLPESAQAGYLPFEQDLVQVLDPDGSLYRDRADSPVAVMGDSFAMWLAEESGGISAHLAKELGFPVASAPSKGGGPKVPRVLASKGPEFLAARRVIVWVMVSRYLSDPYAREWETPPALP